MIDVIIKTIRIAANLRPLQAVQLPDGQIGATLRSLCLVLSLNLSGQRQRLHRQPSLAAGLVTITLKTSGGVQEVDVLLAWAIPLWAASLQANRLNASKRASILTVQREAVPALYRAFWRAAAPQAAPPEVEAEIEVEAEVETALPDPVEARVATIEAALRSERAKRSALEATLRDEVARRASLEMALHNELAQRVALARRLTRTEALLAAAIERLIPPDRGPQGPDFRPPRRGPGRPRGPRR